jgi:hypothetical protein
LFVVGGVQTNFPAEQYIELIDEMVVPNMPKDENIIVDDIVSDILGCFTPKSTPDPEPISLIIQHRNLCLIIILTIELEIMEIILSNLCIRDVT